MILFQHFNFQNYFQKGFLDDGCQGVRDDSTNILDEDNDVSTFSSQNFFMTKHKIDVLIDVLLAI